MPTIVFVEHHGEVRHIEAPPGQSVMQAALHLGVAAVIGECGGNCSCATCHGYVDEDWLGRVPPPNAIENDLLQFVPNAHKNSRLTCQIRMTEQLDGLTIRLPPPAGCD